MIGKTGRVSKKRKKETVFRGTGKQKLARSLSPYSTGEFAFKMLTNILSHKCLSNDKVVKYTLVI